MIHAQKADRKGNVLLWGIVGVQKEAVLAARRAIVTVEEIVETSARPGAQCGRAAVLGGQRCVRSTRRRSPSYAHGYYERDNSFYKAWDAIARDATLRSWMREHILETKDFAGSSRSGRRELMSPA